MSTEDIHIWSVLRHSFFWPHFVFARATIISQVDSRVPNCLPQRFVSYVLPAAFGPRHRSAQTLQHDSCSHNDCVSDFHVNSANEEIEKEGGEKISLLV